MRMTCSLPAPPKPQTVVLTCDGAYSVQTIPCAPQTASAAPRAWQTDMIVRGLEPMKSVSKATATGACSAIRSRIAPWIAASRCSGASRGPVRTVPCASASESRPSNEITP